MIYMYDDNIKTESRETDTVNANNKSCEKQNLSIKFLTSYKIQKNIFCLKLGW